MSRRARARVGCDHASGHARALSSRPFTSRHTLVYVVAAYALTAAYSLSLCPLYLHVEEGAAAVADTTAMAQLRAAVVDAQPRYVMLDLRGRLEAASIVGLNVFVLAAYAFICYAVARIRAKMRERRAAADSAAARLADQNILRVLIVQVSACAPLFDQ